jgi:hypothetical protein
MTPRDFWLRMASAIAAFPTTDPLAKSNKRRALGICDQLASAGQVEPALAMEKLGVLAKHEIVPVPTDDGFELDIAPIRPGVTREVWECNVALRMNSMLSRYQREVEPDTLEGLARAKHQYKVKLAAEAALDKIQKLRSK